jgi:hypothetical protein
MELPNYSCDLELPSLLLYENGRKQVLDLTPPFISVNMLKSCFLDLNLSSIKAGQDCTSIPFVTRRPPSIICGSFTHAPQGRWNLRENLLKASNIALVSKPSVREKPRVKMVTLSER